MGHEYAGGKCMICGYDKCQSALEFHHIDPKTKFKDVSKLKIYAWKRVKVEIDKCLYVCANCHREIHEGLFILGTDLPLPIAS